MIIAGVTQQHASTANFVFFLPSVIQSSRSVVEVTMAIQDARKQQNRPFRVVGDPVAVAGKRVVAKQLIEVAVSPTVCRWFR